MALFTVILRHFILAATDDMSEDAQLEAFGKRHVFRLQHSSAANKVWYFSTDCVPQPRAEYEQWTRTLRQLLAPVVAASEAQGE